jgi:HTH-type transcriptional regulator/antitoxin HigA
VKQFPLIHIRDDHHLEQTQKVIDQLLQKTLDEGAQADLDVLTDLVETYEEAHEPMPDVSEADLRRELMRSNGLSQEKLEKQVGIAQSTISAVLNGTRSLTKEQMVRLARFFHLSPAVFLPT